ncbi:MAG TPA: hypothetical protein VE130_15105 [Nitrososphaeraceae archaeon]|jgi:hypothetical protein|nr:hypothetical protein [Nitrososphaeraceae archaeon]
MAHVKAIQSESNNGSASITLRFRSEILDKLRHEAHQKRINVNTLSSQILADHVDYGSYASASGMVSFPKSLLTRMMDRLEEDEVEKLSEHIAKNEFKDLTLLLIGEYNLHSFLKTLESWLRISNFQYSFNTADDGDKHRLVIQHDMGKRWSLYFEKLFSYVFNDLPLANRMKCETTDNIVAFTVEE